MKFLAILKDSLRETLDVKLFYFMVGLSLLFVLLVFSITYKPEPMHTQVEPLLTLATIDLSNDLRQSDETKNLVVSKAEGKKFESLTPNKDVWDSDYRFNLVLTLDPNGGNRGGRFGRKPDPEKTVGTETAAKRVVAAKKKLTADYIRDHLKQALFFIKQVEVKPAAVEPDDVDGKPTVDPNKVAYEVTLRGTTIKSRKEWFHKPALFFGAVTIPIPLLTLGAIVEFIGSYLVGGFGTGVIMLLSTIMTASFLPSMLHKGTIDLLLTKPIHRGTLFLYKFLGGLIFMFINTAVILGGIWLALGVQTGLWTNSFLVCIFVYTFQFAIFYSVSALAAVYTRSAIVAIMSCMALWAFLFVLGWAHWIFVERDRAKRVGTTPHWGVTTFDVIAKVMPRYKEIDWLTTRMIRQDVADQLLSSIPRQEDRDRAREKFQKDLDKDYGMFSWGTSLAVTGAFIGVMLGLACWRFSTKDY
jgi:ABC-type transport system involved in multi-copper enzyme maturation permease subunit